MNALVVGGYGMLGTDLVANLRQSGHQVTGLSSTEFNITDPTAVAELATGHLGSFDVVFNCAAYTKVDLAESEPQRAFEVNALGAGYLAQAASQLNIPLFHVSTDFVFRGDARVPYLENSQTDPIAVYGTTKAEGEERVLSYGGSVVRTSWLYGAHGPCFPKSIIRAWTAGKPLRVVSDQVGCPTYTNDLALALVRLAEQPLRLPIYHVAGPEPMSWHAFATRAVTAFAQRIGAPEPVQIDPILTSDWPTPAVRPTFSALATHITDGLGITPLPRVQVSFEQFLDHWSRADDFPAR